MAEQMTYASVDDVETFAQDEQVTPMLHEKGY